MEKRVADSIVQIIEVNPVGIGHLVNLATTTTTIVLGKIFTFVAFDKMFAKKLPECFEMIVGGQYRPEGEDIIKLRSPKRVLTWAQVETFHFDPRSTRMGCRFFRKHLEQAVRLVECPIRPYGKVEARGCIGRTPSEAI